MPTLAAKTTDMAMSAILIGIMSSAQAMPDSATWGTMLTPVVFKVFLISAIAAFVQHTRTPGEFGTTQPEKTNA